MTFRAPLWPLRVVDGDFAVGDRREAIRSDIMMVVGVRRFVNVNLAGEYVMRPNAFSAIPFSIMAPFDPYLIGPMTEAYLYEALSHLEFSGKIRILRIRTTVVTGGIIARVEYEIPETQEQDSYDYIMASSPSGTLPGSGRMS